VRSCPCAPVMLSYVDHSHSGGAPIYVHLNAWQTTIPPYVARCITRWLQELRAGRTDIIQAHFTLVKYPRRSTPYEAHLELVLDGPILFTMHPGQTQIAGIGMIQERGRRHGRNRLRPCQSRTHAE
jgi:hypothetical protein